MQIKMDLFAFAAVNTSTEFQPMHAKVSTIYGIQMLKPTNSTMI